MKINDTQVKERLGIKNDAYYKWKKRRPQDIELIKKGLVAEKVLNKDIFDEMIKPDNKPRSK